MTRIAVLLVVALGLLGCATPEQPTVDLLAKTYTFGVAEEPVDGCRVTLDAAPTARASSHRRVEIGAACSEKFSSLFAVTQWAATGGASIALFGGEPLHEIADFSPVQDGTGVYLRGGFQGDARTYELRALGE